LEQAMNTRALYWATKAIVGAILFSLFALLSSGEEFFTVSWAITAAAGFISLSDMLNALKKLKAEANRGTVFGLNGPSRKDDLLP
jgi:hypothetical protein